MGWQFDHVRKEKDSIFPEFDETVIGFSGRRMGMQLDKDTLATDNKFCSHLECKDFGAIAELGPPLSVPGKAVNYRDRTRVKEIAFFRFSMIEDTSDSCSFCTDRRY